MECYFPQTSHIRLRSNLPTKIEILAHKKIYAEFQFDIFEKNCGKLPINFQVKLWSEKKMSGCCGHHKKKHIEMKMYISMNNKTPNGINKKYTISDEEFLVKKVSTKTPVIVGPYGKEIYRHEQKFPNHIYITFVGPPN